MERVENNKGIRLKLCFVSFEYPPRISGGAGTYAESLVKGFEAKGIDVHTITMGEMEIHNEENHGILAPNASHWQRYYFTKRALSLSRSEKFDLVHFNGLYPIVRSLKLPTVCTLHCSQFAILKTSLEVSRKLKTVGNIRDLVLKQPLLCLFDVLMVRVADKIICPSPSLARALSYYHVDNRKIHVIPNGIDLEKIDRTKALDDDLSKEYPLAKENFILYMGRLAPVKGIEYLIEAFKSIRKECTNLKLVIAGSGDYELYLKSLARNTSDILFVGFIRSPNTKKFLYENSLAVVVPSLHETFPLVPLEAMAHRKPVIGTDVGDLQLMIKHGKSGFLARRGNSGDLAKFITLLHHDSDLRRRMGNFGRKKVEEEFTVDRMVSETLEVYKSLS